jgi:hypothetical protein
MSDTKAEPVILSNPKLAALAVAIDGHLRGVNQLPNGRLEFAFDGVPRDLEEQVINDEIQVSAKKFIDAMEAVLGIIASRRRAR